LIRLVPVAFVDFALWQMPVHAYDSQKKAPKLELDTNDESLEQTGRKKRIAIDLIAVSGPVSRE
jgi:hypothetical protein